MITRPEGDITWSSDGGRTWTKPVTFGMRMFEPGLLVLRDGTLLCLHGSYGAGGFRAIFSADGGQTWVAPASKHVVATDDRSLGLRVTTSSLRLSVVSATTAGSGAKRGVFLGEEDRHFLNIDPSLTPSAPLG